MQAINREEAKTLILLMGNLEAYKKRALCMAMLTEVQRAVFRRSMRSAEFMMEKRWHRDLTWEGAFATALTNASRHGHKETKK